MTAPQHRVEGRRTQDGGKRNQCEDSAPERTLSHPAEEPRAECNPKAEGRRQKEGLAKEVRSEEAKRRKGDPGRQDHPPEKEDDIGARHSGARVGAHQKHHHHGTEEPANAAHQPSNAADPDSFSHARSTAPAPPACKKNGRAHHEDAEPPSEPRHVERGQPVGAERDCHRGSSGEREHAAMLRQPDGPGQEHHCRGGIDDRDHDDRIRRRDRPRRKGHEDKRGAEAAEAAHGAGHAPRREDQPQSQPIHTCILRDMVEQ